MANNYDQYKKGLAPQKESYRVWPLYGAGLENLGINHQILYFNFTKLGDDELLIRHDACGLCFSDIKVIKLGQEHPRIFRDMKESPVVLGHEISLTVVGVGKELKSDYQVGDRFILQADIFVDGVNFAYGYEFQGGLSEYNVIDQRILQGGKGGYLIPIKSTTGYAESALVEPWACVIAAYYLEYRKSIKDQGTCLFFGPEPQRELRIEQGMDKISYPAKIILCDFNGPMADWLKKRAAELGIECQEVAPEELTETFTKESIDDIFLFDPSPSLIEKVNPLLKYHGVMVISKDKKNSEIVQIDVGRIHYNRWLIIGGDESDLSQIYLRNPVQSSLFKDSKVLFVGAGGPMGRMHVQHAIEANEKPKTIVCTDLSDMRLDDLSETYRDQAIQNGIQWICFNPDEKSKYFKNQSHYSEGNFNYIIVLAPISSAITESSKLLAQNGVMNIFAGISRGNFASIDLADIIFKNIRIIGHSASSIDDMKMMLNEVENGILSTNTSVAAIGSLEAVPEGLQAVLDAKYPGKIVIFPNIKPLPLTAVSDLDKVLPTVFAKLDKGKTWTKAAEMELLNQMALIED
jgi:D-arabinose 1-dehydrogenase-like Zn-dependent alcohol dehydrogenase